MFSSSFLDGSILILIYKFISAPGGYCQHQRQTRGAPLHPHVSAQSERIFRLDYQGMLIFWAADMDPNKIISHSASNLPTPGVSKWCHVVPFGILGLGLARVYTWTYRIFQLSATRVCFFLLLFNLDVIDGVSDSLLLDYFDDLLFSLCACVCLDFIIIFF